MAESNGITGRIDSTVAALKEGAMQVALDKARGEVAGWRQTLQDSGEQQLTPITDNLAALETQLSMDPLDGPVIGRTMRELAGQTRELASGDLLGAGAGNVPDRLESLAGLLDKEGSSLSDAG
jgi:hypothetical protein